MATPEAEVEGVARVDEKSSSDPEKVYSLEKGPQDDVKTGQSPELLPDYENSSDVVGSADDLVTHVIQVEDDPSIYPWTFRMLFLDLLPQVICVSQVFLTVIAYVLGEGMAYAIPRRGWIGRLLNPGPFNAKEHAAIALMASAASQSALATEALAVQQLYYGGYPSHAAGVFITLSSQLIGYGIAGLLRDIIVRPTKMLWPMTLPISSLLESLHKNKQQSKARLKV
ncbi:isp4 a membrane oligopeptide transporter, partial [Rasamsonia emersonii CBS 393.64]